VPVIVILLLLLGRALILVGSFLGHYRSKVQSDLAIVKNIEQLNVNNLVDMLHTLPGSHKSLLVSYARKIAESNNSQAQLQRLLACFEIDADKDIALSKHLTKLGPILGLMGTLIPMGPALVGLATGDISSMAQNMQVAFATTVIGLLTGAIGYITLQYKQRWYLQDLTNLEYLVQLITENEKNVSEPAMVKEREIEQLSKVNYS